jgi:undecaprenyl-diphosphatase
MSRAAPARLLIAIAVGCVLLALPLHGSDLDRRAFLAVNDAAWRWAAPALLSGITVLGHGLAAAMLLAPTLLRAPNLLLAGLLATPVAMVLSWLPKGVIDSARPLAVLDPASVHVVGMRLAGHNSFPSGHTITALLVVGVLWAGGAARPRWPWAVAATTVGLAVALSRIAVGAHWPSDTLAGAGLGLLAGAVGAQAERHWQLAARPAARPLLALVVLACAATLARVDTGYPLARPLQFALAALGAAMAAMALWRAWADRRQGPGTAARPSG